MIFGSVVAVLSCFAVVVGSLSVVR